jgi:hypothetical protein
LDVGKALSGQAGEHLGKGRCQSISKDWLASPWTGWSHLVLTKAGIRANLTVHQHTELAPGTLRGLIRTAGLKVDEFLALL